MRYRGRLLHGDVALPEVSPVVFMGAAAVLVSLPAVAGVVSSAIFAGGSSCRRTDGHCQSDWPDGYWERIFSRIVGICA